MFSQPVSKICFRAFPSTTYLDKNFDFDKLFGKLFSQFLSEHDAQEFPALLLSIWTATSVDMLFYALAQEVSDHGTLAINTLQFARKM